MISRLLLPQNLGQRRKTFSPITLRIFASGQPSAPPSLAVKNGKVTMVRHPAGFTISPSGPSPPSVPLSRHRYSNNASVLVLREVRSRYRHCPRRHADHVVNRRDKSATGESFPHLAGTGELGKPRQTRRACGNERFLHRLFRGWLS